MKYDYQTQKITILNIINHLPPYDIFSAHVAPDKIWTSDNDRWIGVWNSDFPHLLGASILKLTDEFNYEIWQPDIRADRVYSHTFENRLTHRVFPAQCVRKRYGFKYIEEISSAPMIEELRTRHEQGAVLLHLNGSFPGINKDILETIDKIPVIFSLHGAQLEIPSTQFFTFTKNFPCKFNLFQQQLWLKKHINTIRHITYCSAHNIDHLRRIYRRDLSNITMGCDFSVFRKMDTVQCRKQLRLPLDTFIMITVANYNMRKQQDKLIAVLNTLARQCNFLYIVIGASHPEYGHYLQKVARPLVEKNMITFKGYRKNQELVTYLNSADMFVSGSLSEGASVSIMEALACELPVCVTKTGQTSELLAHQRAGCLMDVRDYRQWANVLGKIIKTKALPVILDRTIAQKYYDWPVVAGKFIALYRRILA